MSTTHPEIAAELHPTRNEVTADEVVVGTNKKLWWQCEVAADHVWRAPGFDRLKGNGCPFCAGQRVTVSNSMATTHPEMAAQLHPTRNSFGADEVTAGTSRKLWWQCDAAGDHVWEAKGSTRFGGSGCPFCAGQRVTASNSMATTRPDLAAELHPTRNDVTADEVTAKTSRKLWWQCYVAYDHFWEATGSDRALGKGCPFCAGRRVTMSNCMATTHPLLARQFHPTRNGELTPEGLVAGTNKKLWWQCTVDPAHEWQATGNHRSRKYPAAICRYC